MNAPQTGLAGPIGFLPGLRVEDPLAAHWLRQVMLRLRREICWLWRERGMLSGASSADGAATLPPFGDRLGGALDLHRYEEEKRAFFATDTAARYLGERIGEHGPPAGASIRGSFAWVCAELALSDFERFALAAALLPMVDAAAGTVVAACLNDAAKVSPTAALLQRLMDAPEPCLTLVDGSHALSRHGLWRAPADWDAALLVAAPIARQLLFPGSALPAPLVVVAAGPDAAAPGAADALAARLAGQALDGVRVIPVLAAAGLRPAPPAARFAQGAGQVLLTPAPGARAADFATCCTLAWLRGAALYVDFSTLAPERAEGHGGGAIELPLPALPLDLYVGCPDRTASRRFGSDRLMPPLVPQGLTFDARVALWKQSLQVADDDAAWHDALADCARRYRYERDEIEAIARGLRMRPQAPQPHEVLAACRSELDLGELAQPLVPRFARTELMLPAKASRQIDELILAARNLTRTHHEWGTAHAWNESGLSALFSGPPGTGKTMAAEVIASELGCAMYRIDLSQVVNKYIGETEKNLRRLFDAADRADSILFFDEADALFGKRTEVKDAHDRYANIEVGYLLERMERFKGLAILATNRRKDLDEAFMRRLRFSIEFPLPEAAERRRIWESAIPREVDGAALDLAFLSQRFPLAGGHIRAVVFHACLQKAGSRQPRQLDMPVVLQAVRREYEKLGRTVSREQLGPWAHLGGDER